jgi:hypothetical protein
MEVLWGKMRYEKKRRRSRESEQSILLGELARKTEPHFTVIHGWLAVMRNLVEIRWELGHQL